MNKPVFKVVDRKGKVLIPQSLRQYLGVDNGDTVSLTAENGKVVIKKAIVTDDNKISPEAKCRYAQVAIGESDAMDLSNLLELAARFIKDEK